MNIPIWQYVLSMGGYIALLTLVITIMRRYYRFANIFWILALFTFPLWLNGNVEGWFRWAKNLSVFIPTILVGFSRIAYKENKQGKAWSFLQKSWVYWVLYCVLFLNIFEATLKDFQMNNLMNALAGFILCATIPFPGRYWKFERENKGDLIIYTTIGWNLLYTTWNACFVFAETPVYFASSLCIIFAAELYPFLKRKPELYIMARIYTLATHLLIRSCVPKLFPSLMNAQSWQNPSILKYWGIVNAVVAIPYLFWYLWQLHTNKAETTFIQSSRGIPNS